MNKYLSKENIKLYVFKEDKIVFLATSISIIWIFFYKILFLKINAPFIFIYDIGDLFYVILSSVIAAGLFYIFTVFIVRCSRIKKMITNITSYLEVIETYSRNTIESILNGDEKYDRFKMTENVSQFKVDFVSQVKVRERELEYIDSMNVQIRLLSRIVTNYSDIINNDIAIGINNCISDFEIRMQGELLWNSNLKYYSGDDYKKEIVTIFVKILTISQRIRNIYKIELEDNAFNKICQGSS